MKRTAPSHPSSTATSARVGSWLGALTIVLAFAPFAAGDTEGGKAGGLRLQDMASDPTVGTLPMVGGENAPASEFDQTLTLRGTIQDVREAVEFIDATAGGSVEIVQLGDEEIWVRFYGNVTVELDVNEVADVELEIFNGFDGGGMIYAVETAVGISAPHKLGSGNTIPVDVQRFAMWRLFDAPVTLRALHTSGQLTETRFTIGASSSGDQVLTVGQSIL